MTKATYQSAGVDLDIYAESMSRVARQLQRTRSPRVVPLADGFAGLFQLDFTGSPLFARNYENPVLVSCTDGVGTKLKVAVMAGQHQTVGIDLVAMSINDALCCGAEPLFFLDYVAMSKDDPDLLEAIVSGVVQGCMQSDCALLGGETAIMPDIYAPGDYDLAGFCVGVVERKRVITGQQIAPDDVVLGLASTGFHSNGYSLIRRVVFDMAGLKIDDHVPELGQTVAQALLTPTRIYAQPLRRVQQHYKVKQVIHGIAHITGGGLRENLARIVPAGVQILIQPHSWPVPPVFRWLQRLGEIEETEMERVFNMGIGMVLVVSPYYAEAVRRQIEELGIETWTIGKAVAGPQGVEWDSTNSAG